MQLISSWLLFNYTAGSGATVPAAQWSGQSCTGGGRGGVCRRVLRSAPWGHLPYGRQFHARVCGFLLVYFLYYTFTHTIIIGMSSHDGILASKVLRE